MKNLDLLLAEPVIKKISEKELPALMAFKIFQTLDAITTALKAFYQARDKLVQRYAVKDQTGSVIFENGVPRFAENAPFVFQELDQLAGIELDLEFTPIPVSFLKTISLTPGDFSAIKWLITDDSIFTKE